MNIKGVFERTLLLLHVVALFPSYRIMLKCSVTVSQAGKSHKFNAKQRHFI